MLTLAKVEATYGLTHDDHLDREAEIPTVTTLAAQGDVFIRKVDHAPATTPVPREGVAVVRGENGGNTHLLVGDALFNPQDDGTLVIGHATIPEGATALLSHPEHGGMLLAPGTYEIRRQREQADEIRMVRD